ncbi:MAG: outer membrane lipoprotein carrier protein LolA [Methanosarcinales archaeon]|nr:outer membrane lipoprotein carrier protein LolA [Methanosarcinales archaeon]
MKIYTIICLQILLITLIAGCTDIPEKVISGEEIAKKFIEKQENIQDYSATATITTTQPSDTFTVKIMFKKPNKHKIEYLETSRNLGEGIAITDGSTGVWNYYPEAKSADHTNQSQILNGRNMDINPYFYGRDYYIIAKNIIEKSNISYKGTETIGEHHTYVIEAIPEEPYNENYYSSMDDHKIRVWIDTESWIIQKMVSYDEENNSLSKIESIDTKFDIGILDAEFIFEPPEGVEIDDMTYFFSHSKPHINPNDIVLSTPSNESELISFVFPEAWLLENDENEDPEIINLSFPSSQLNNLLIYDEEYSEYLTPEDITDNEKVVLLKMPKTMFKFFNKDPDTVAINFPIEKFESYPNISEMFKLTNDTKGE